MASRTGIPGERFPLQSSIVLTIPWAAIAPYEAQAMRNHSQTLTRLAERCGLGIEEALVLMRDQRLFSPEWYALLKLPHDQLVKELEVLCAPFGAFERRTGDDLSRWERDQQRKKREAKEGDDA